MGKKPAEQYLDPMTWLRAAWRVDHLPLRTPIGDFNVFHRSRVQTEATPDVVYHDDVQTFAVPPRYWSLLAPDLSGDDVVRMLRAARAPQEMIDELLALELALRLKDSPFKTDVPKRSFSELPLALHEAGYDPRVALLYPDVARTRGCIELARLLEKRRDLWPPGASSAAEYLLHAADMVEVANRRGPMQKEQVAKLPGPVGVAYNFRCYQVWPGGPEALHDGDGITAWHKLVTAAASLDSSPAVAPPGIYGKRTRAFYKTCRDAVVTRSRVAVADTGADTALGLL